MGPAPDSDRNASEQEREERERQMERWKQFKAEMPRKYEQSRHFALESAAYECGCTRADLEAALTSQDPDYMAEERRVFADAFDKRMRDCGYSL